MICSLISCVHYSFKDINTRNSLIKDRIENRVRVLQHHGNIQHPTSSVNGFLEISAVWPSGYRSLIALEIYARFTPVASYLAKVRLLRPMPQMIIRETILSRTYLPVKPIAHAPADVRSRYRSVTARALIKVLQPIARRGRDGNQRSPTQSPIAKPNFAGYASPCNENRLGILVALRAASAKLSAVSFRLNPSRSQKRRAGSAPDSGRRVLHAENYLHGRKHQMHLDKKLDEFERGILMFLARFSDTSAHNASRENRNLGDASRFDRFRVL